LRAKPVCSSKQSIAQSVVVGILHNISGSSSFRFENIEMRFARSLGAFVLPTKIVQHGTLLLYRGFPSLLYPFERPFHRCFRGWGDGALRSELFVCGSNHVSRGSCYCTLSAPSIPSMLLTFCSKPAIHVTGHQRQCEYHNPLGSFSVDGLQHAAV